MPITEAELRIAALRLLAAAPGGFIATENLIPALEHEFNPVGTDAAILNGRSDTHFSQKVRNLISHRNEGYGLVRRGFVVYDEMREGLQITESGRAFIATL